ncbi:30S ribosomal protein S5 [bacterium]|nr:MAG: 30S ribosomal protein S5 [bacterium]
MYQRNNNRPNQRMKPKSEFRDKVLEVRRVTRVMAGGKRFSFRATVVMGDQKGRVGVGIAKGLDVAAAVEKGKRQAQKNMIFVTLKDNRTVPHDVEAKYGAARVRIKPARPNHGLIAGGSARVVLEMVGIKDISAKILGRTTNKLSNAMATVEALKKLQKPFIKEDKGLIQKSEQKGE